MAALSYGLWTVFIARSVHLVFKYSRMSVVHAIDIDADQLAKVPSALQQLPLTGPTAIALRPFIDATEQFDLTMAAINGNPLSVRGYLWQPYAVSVPNVLQETRTIENLRARFPSESALIDRAVTGTGKSPNQLRYLPLAGRNTAWTELLGAVSAEPLGFLPLDSF